MKKKIKDYLPKKEKQKMLQVRVEMPMYKKVERKRKQLGYTMKDVVTAMFKQFLDEENNAKKS